MKLTDQQKILLVLSDGKWRKVSKIMGLHAHKVGFLPRVFFIGYEAGTRIGDLARKGYLEKRKDGKFTEYRLNSYGQVYAGLTLNSQGEFTI